MYLGTLRVLFFLNLLMKDAALRDFPRLSKKLLEKWTPVTENLVARGLCNDDLYYLLEVNK